MTAQLPNELKIVQHWHAALNEGNAEKLSALVSPGVRMEGPRGTTAGVAIMLQWVGRANVRMRLLRYFCQKDLIVVEALSEWHALQAGEPSSQTVASVFAVQDGRIASIARYGGLLEAFAASGLSASDEVLV